MVLTNTIQFGEVIIWYADQDYCFTTKTYSNSSGDEVTILPGRAFDDNVLVAAAGEANTDGIAARKYVVADGTSEDVAILARGPATVQLSSITEANTGLTIATIETALAGLTPPILTVAIPTNTETLSI